MKRTVNPTRRMRVRLWLIVGVLVAIGITSIGVHIHLDKTYTIGDAFYDLGFECMTAALFFLLLDQAIRHRHEQQQLRSDVITRLRGEEDSSNVMLTQLAKGSHISGLNLSDSSSSLAFDLTDKTLVSCTFDRCDLDNSSFAHCKLRSISLRQASLRLAVFDGCRLDNVSFDGSDLTGTLFSNSKINNESSFKGATLTDVRFNKCQLTVSTVRAAMLSGATFNNCTGLDSTARALLTGQNPAIAG